MPASLNGAALERSLRIVIIGHSIRSDWHNPRAHTHRQVVRAVTSAGHDVLFLEERRNSSVVGQMTSSGPAALFAFDDDYPDIRYRSYDPPPPRELGVWLGLQASTAELMIMLDDAPEALLAAFRALQAPHLVRLHEFAEDDSTFLMDTQTGSPVTAYHPVPPSGASAIAGAIESAWLAAGIRM